MALEPKIFSNPDNSFNMLTLAQIKKIKPSSQVEREKETGFTLLELMIVMVVIGILVAIVILAGTAQQREAVIATVKSDTYSNKDVMAPGLGQKLYASPNYYAQSANYTGDNITFYVVNPNQTEACTHTLRVFDADDIVVYRFWTKIGKLEADYCPDLGGGSIEVSNGNGRNIVPATPANPAEPQGPGNPANPANPADPAQPGNGGNINNNDGGYGTDPIRPGNSVTTITVNMTSNETYRVCYNVIVRTTSATGAPWSVYIDKTVAPFAFGNFIEGLNDSRYHINDNGDHYLLYGSAQMLNASTTNTVSPSFCVKAPNNLPVIPTKIDSTVPITSPIYGDMHNATQNFTVRNSSQYFSGWTAEVDLTDLKNTVSGKPGAVPFVDTDVQIQHVSGNIYRISSSISYRSIKEGNDTTITVRLG